MEPREVTLCFVRFFYVELFIVIPRFCVIAAAANTVQLRAESNRATVSSEWIVSVKLNQRITDCRTSALTSSAHARVLSVIVVKDSILLSL